MPEVDEQPPLEPEVPPVDVTTDYEFVEPDVPATEPEKVDDRNSDNRSLVEQLDETVAILAAEMLGGM